ncbi:MAG: YgcG family protein, partial [Betaproteobacteria bacterium]
MATLSLFAFAGLGPAQAADVPFLTGRVVDNAEILKPATREKITAELKAHEQASGDQIAVLTVPTIGDDSIEEYAVKVFENWKLGQKGKDNGVLVVVAPKDRKMRIEVGYGLEGTLTDAMASRIIRNVMTPSFKAGDFDRGIAAGVEAIVAQLEGKPGVAAEEASPASGSSGLHINAPDLPWPERILLGAFIFGIIGLFTFVGVMTPGVGWFLYVFLIPFWAMFPIIIVGTRGALTLLGIYVVGYPLAKLMLSHTAWYEKAAASLKSKGSASVGG